MDMLGYEPDTHDTHDNVVRVVTGQVKFGLYQSFLLTPPN